MLKNKFIRAKYPQIMNREDSLKMQEETRIMSNLRCIDRIEITNSITPTITGEANI